MSGIEFFPEARELGAGIALDERFRSDHMDRRCGRGGLVSGLPEIRVAKGGGP
jgi:hypothetical protein